MATTMPWGETVEILMEIGFLTTFFTLDDATLGQLDTGGYLDGTLLGVDVSPYLQEMQVSRGRTDQLQQINAGTASFTLVNNDRRFDPINESSPYWDVSVGRTGVQPRRSVKVYIDGIQVFDGRITDIDIQYDQQRSTVVIDAADDFVLLANQSTDAEITPIVELSGARVEKILDLPEIDFSATDRDIDSGTVSLGAYLIPVATNALTYLQDIAKSEQGYMFISHEGSFKFTNRADYVWATSAVAFSDTGADIRYTNLAVTFGQEFLYNKVLVQRQGGVEQVVDDASSQTTYGISSLDLTNMLLSDDSQALTLAQTLLDDYKEPLYRFNSLTVVMNQLTSVQRSAVLNLDLAEALTVTRNFDVGTPSSVTKGFGVQRIIHNINQTGHTTSIGLENQNLVYEFILDDAVFGVLDSSNALA